MSLKHRALCVLATICAILSCSHFFLSSSTSALAEATIAPATVEFTAGVGDYCSVPPSPEPTLLEQPDGSRFNAYLRLAENVVYLETTDGYTIMQDPEDDYYRFASRGTDGNLALTRFPVSAGTKRSPALRQLLNSLPRHLRYSGKKLTELKDNYPLKRVEEDGEPVINAVFPPTGVQRSLLLLIDFPDQLQTYPLADFERLANEEGYSRNGASGSFRDYYIDISYGQLIVNTDVFGWYTAANNRATYGIMDRDNRDFSGGPDIVREAVDAAEAAGVDFSNYDGDNDGRVDVVEVIHSGRGAEESSSVDDIWSHRWVLGAQSVTYDGKVISDYIIQAEKYGANNITNIGVLVHEFGHALGLPDLYDTDGGSAGIGRWCCMAGGTWNDGGRTPAHFSAWCKSELGWTNPTVLTGMGNVANMPTSETNQDAYRFNTADNNQYFLLENRQKEGWDAFIPGEGLMIYHIDESKFSNADQNHRKVEIEQADGNRNLNGGNGSNSGDGGDTYPGNSGNTSFNCSTNPNSNLYDGGATNINISNIVVANDLVSFSYDFCSTDCVVENIQLNGGSANLDNGLYDQSFTVSYGFAPDNGTLNLSAAGITTNVAITGSPQTITLTGLPADGTLVTVTASFSADGDCELTRTDLYVAPQECANDDFCSALDVTANIGGNPVSCNNFGATVQANEPKPGYESGGCDRQDAWCDNELHNTVWFKFTAPASGSIDIDFTSANDLQMAIWEVHGQCGTLGNPGAALLVAANDDSGSGGSFSPRIQSLGCLVPGKMYYVQVDGYNGVTADFTFEITDPEVPCGVAPLASASCDNTFTGESGGKGTWQHIVDGDGNCIASINDRFNELGAISLSYGVNSGDMRLDAQDFPLMDRDWFITVANNNGANVRLYLTDAEYEDFVAAGGAANLAECSLLKVSGGDCGEYSGASSEILYAVNSKMNFARNKHMVEFQVTGFSGFFPRSAEAALPIEFSYVRGEVSPKFNLLEWGSVREDDTSVHEIERSPNGTDSWSVVGSLAAAGSSQEALDYRWEDRYPLPLAYYRIKTVDLDGSFQYSELIDLAREGDEASIIQVFPNPTDRAMTADLHLPTAENVSWKLHNANGQQLNGRNYRAAAGREQIQLDLSAYPPGLYLLEVRIGKQQMLRKLMKR